MDHAIDHFLLKQMNCPDTPESRHSTPEFVGFIGCEFCSLNCNPHRLFLKQGNAECFAKYTLEFIRWAIAELKKPEVGQPVTVV
jgi:hypothetical protein